MYFCEDNDIADVELIVNFLRNNFKDYDFIRGENKLEDWEQLLLMSVCKDFIIANSTFSWFGAYFCENTNKIVCYPSVWFGPGYADKKTYDMFPAEWKMVVG